MCMAVANVKGAKLAYFYTPTELEDKMLNARKEANEKAKKKAENEGKEYVPKFSQAELDEVSGSQKSLAEKGYNGTYYANRRDFVPQPGDLIFFHNSNWESAWGHVGIVTGRDGDIVYFIDGNNNGNGTPKDGTTNVMGKVYERKVNYTTDTTHIIAFARPNYAKKQ